MKVIIFIEADKDLKTVLDTVNDSDNVMTITRRDADDAVIMSLKNFHVHLLAIELTPVGRCQFDTQEVSAALAS